MQRSSPSLWGRRANRPKGRPEELISGFVPGTTPNPGPAQGSLCACLSPPTPHGAAAQIQAHRRPHRPPPRPDLPNPEPGFAGGSVEHRAGLSRTGGEGQRPEGARGPAAATHCSRTAPPRSAGPRCCRRRGGPSSAAPRGCARRPGGPAGSAGGAAAHWEARVREERTQVRPRGRAARSPARRAERENVTHAQHKHARPPASETRPAHSRAAGSPSPACPRPLVGLKGHDCNLDRAGGTISTRNVIKRVATHVFYNRRLCVRGRQSDAQGKAGNWDLTRVPLWEFSAETPAPSPRTWGPGTDGRVSCALSPAARGRPGGSAERGMRWGQDRTRGRGTTR